MRPRRTAMMTVIGFVMCSWTAIGSDGAPRQQSPTAFDCPCRFERHTYCQEMGDSIPDGSTMLAVPIVVPYEYILMGVTVCLDIVHPQVGELVLDLTGPAGTESPRVLLAEGSSGANYGCTRFDDGASVTIRQGSAPYTGDFRPLESLGAFTGTNALGTWTLTIRDTVPGHQGWFTGACLSLWGLSCLPLDSVVIGGEGGLIAVHWNAPERQPYQVWSSTDAQADGDPHGGDPKWRMETELYCEAGPTQWVDPEPPVYYKTYVVTRTCDVASSEIRTSAGTTLPERAEVRAP